MAYNDSNLLTDSGGRIIPCYFNPSTGLYEPVEGKNGASNVRTKNGHDIALGHSEDPYAQPNQLGDPQTAISLIKGA